MSRSSPATTGDPEYYARRGYFSFRSPYSWLLHRRLARLDAAQSDRTQWLPFFEGRTFEHIARIPSAPTGLGCSPVTVAQRGESPKPDWDKPHLAVLAVPARQRAAFIDAIFRTRWVEGDDVCDPRVLCELAGGIGAAAAVAESAENAAVLGVARVLRYQACLDGAFGVPYLVISGQLRWGLDQVCRAIDDPASIGEMSRPAC